MMGTWGGGIVCVCVCVCHFNAVRGDVIIRKDVKNISSIYCRNKYTCEIYFWLPDTFFIMVSMCCICRIEHGAVENVSHHGLPKKEDLKMKWYANIGRKVGRWSAVCSQHFQEEDFRYKIIGGAVRRFLVPTAIPSLLLNKSDDVQVKTERTIEDDVSQATPNIVNDTALLNNSSEISFVDCKEYQNINSIVSDEGSKAPTLERQYYVQVKAEQTNEDNVSQATPDLNIFNDTALLDDSSEISFEDCKEYQNINNIGSDEGSKAPINIERVVQQPLTDAERWCNARYIGDLQRIDFTSDKSWIIVQDFLKNMRRKQRTSNQKIHRLNRKVKSLKALLNHFKQNSKLSNKAGTSLEIGN